MAPGYFRYATSTNPNSQHQQSPQQQVAPQQRFIRMMDAPRSSVMYPLNYTSSPMAVRPAGGARFPRNTDKSRGLRHFSSRVCEKVKEKVQTNYNEVADELVTEYFDSLPYAPQNQEKQQYDAKNIRRRVYDALNVLMAMNIIEKEKKEIRWVGLPTSSLAEKASQKSDQLREYIIQLVAYKSLVQRNRELERRKGCPPDQAVLFLPFIIVNTERKTVVECAISHDKTEYAMTFERPFEIHDDIEVLKRLGLSYGLDQGRVADEDVERVKLCLPPALRVYVDQILEQPMDEDNQQVDVVQHDSETHPQDNQIANEETVISEEPENKVHVSNPRDLSLHQRSANAQPPKLVKQQQSVAPQQRRYISVAAQPQQQRPQQYTISPGGTEVIPGQYGSNVAVTRPIKRAYVQPSQRTIGTASRYVQPSQSAVYQTAQQQQRSTQLRQQLYLVQGNGSAPQPIHHVQPAGPSRFGANSNQQARRGVHAPAEQQVEYEQVVEDEDFGEIYDDNY
ncbi:hypothetical protein M3Y97_01084100 [Aphelenchoides bicaudatus]|nr:hypothetical protein M3Y97_01084100 [Aphelenchoides bicaudatus]